MTMMLLSSHTPRRAKPGCAHRGESSCPAAFPAAPDGLPATVLTALHTTQACMLKRKGLC